MIPKIWEEANFPNIHLTSPAIAFAGLWNAYSERFNGSGSANSDQFCFYDPQEFAGGLQRFVKDIRTKLTPLIDSTGIVTYRSNFLNPRKLQSWNGETILVRDYGGFFSLPIWWTWDDVCDEFGFDPYEVVCRKLTPCYSSSVFFIIRDIINLLVLKFNPPQTFAFRKKPTALKKWAELSGFVDQSQKLMTIYASGSGGVLLTRENVNRNNPIPDIVSLVHEAFGMAIFEDCVYDRSSICSEAGAHHDGNAIWYDEFESYEPNVKFVPYDSWSKEIDFDKNQALYVPMEINYSLDRYYEKNYYGQPYINKKYPADKNLTIPAGFTTLNDIAGYFSKQLSTQNDCHVTPALNDDTSNSENNRIECYMGDLRLFTPCRYDKMFRSERYPFIK